MHQAAWVIFSLPFWFSGLFYGLLCPYAAFAKRESHESDLRCFAQAVACFTLGCFLLAFAVYLCS